MRSLKYSGTPEPGRWHPISGDDAARARQDMLTRVAGGRRRVVQTPGRVRGRGGVLEYDVVHTDGGERTPHRGDEAVVDADPRERGIREARETVEILTRDFISWLQSGPAGSYEARARHVIALARAAGGLNGMSDEEAMSNLASLCRKVAESDAERAYAEGGLNRTLIIVGDG